MAEKITFAIAEVPCSMLTGSSDDNNVNVLSFLSYVLLHSLLSLSTKLVQIKSL